jgi:hypothetical protein
MKMIRFFIAIFFFINTSMSNGQRLTPKYSNEFLNIGIGARALGMGGAHVSFVNDVTSAFWNPSALMMNPKEKEVGLMHSEYFAGIAKFDYAGFATAFQNEYSIGISLVRFGIDDIPDTRFLYDANGALNYNNVLFFNAADYALLISFAKSLSSRLHLGGNTKIIQRNVGLFANAWGFGFDMGALYSLNNWSLGLMLRDVTTTFNAWKHQPELLKMVYQQTNNLIPNNSIELTLPKAILSASRQHQFSNLWKGAAVLDLELTFDGQRNVFLASDVVNLDPRLGIEIVYDDLLALRVGGSTFQQIRNFDQNKYWVWKPAFGLGMQLSQRFQLDYALSDIGGFSQTPYSHVFSLKFSLDESTVK